MTEKAWGYLESILEEGRLENLMYQWKPHTIDAVLQKAWDDLYNNKQVKEFNMTEQEVTELCSKYEDLHKQWKETQQKACKLSGECSVLGDSLLLALHVLIGHNPKYHCPTCGEFMFLHSEKTDSERKKCLRCTNCHKNEPLFDTELEAYLDWFNKCNNKEIE